MEKTEKTARPVRKGHFFGDTSDSSMQMPVKHPTPPTECVKDSVPAYRVGLLANYGTASRLSQGSLVRGSCETLVGVLRSRIAEILRLGDCAGRVHDLHEPTDFTIGQHGTSTWRAQPETDYGRRWVRSAELRTLIRHFRSVADGWGIVQ